MQNVFFSNFGTFSLYLNFNKVFLLSCLPPSSAFLYNFAPPSKKSDIIYECSLNFSIRTKVIYLINFQVKNIPCLMLIILLVQTEEEFLWKITDRVPWSVAQKIIKIGFYAKKMTESRDLIFPHKRTKVKRVCLVHIFWEEPQILKRKSPTFLWCYSHHLEQPE